MGGRRGIDPGDADDLGDGAVVAAPGDERNDVDGLAMSGSGRPPQPLLQRRCATELKGS